MNNKWSNDLPNEIISLIFKYVEPEVSSLKIFGPDYYRIVNQMQTFQLTCKQWSKPAQLLIYNNVHLYTMRQVRSFEATVRQSREIRIIVRHIVSDLYDDIRIPFPHLIRINSLCTNLKSFRADNWDMMTQWSVIKREVSSGLLSALYVISYLNFIVDYIVVDTYNTMAMEVKSTLKAVTLFDLPRLTATTSLDLNEFNVADELFLVLDENSPLLYKVGQQVNECPAIKTMVIAYYNDVLRQQEDPHLILEKTTEPITPCLHIKRLVLEMKEDSEWRMYRSLMTTFPNLDRLVMIFSKDPKNPADNNLKRFSTEHALQFLKYLMNVPVYYVESLYVQDLTMVLRHWSDRPARIKRLDLTYTWREEEEEASCLSLWVARDTAKICINYASDRPIILPDLDLINTSGQNLHSLKFNMGSDPFLLEQELDVVGNPLYDLSHILYICQDLTSLHISHTGLTILNPDRISPRPLRRRFEEIRIEKSYIDAAFFHTLSRKVSYIHKLTINRCKFICREHNHPISQSFIDMPETSLDQILFGFNGSVLEFYLMIHMVETGMRRFFHNDNSSLRECSELQFLSCGQAPCLSIRCFNYRSLTFKNPKIETFVDTT